MKKLVDLVDDGNILIPRVFFSIDKNDKIIESTFTRYTTIKDCIINIINIQGATQNYYIDDVFAFSLNANASFTLLVKGGTTITSKYGAVENSSYMIGFGIKYN